MALLSLGVFAGLLLAEGIVRLAAAAPEVMLVEEGRFRLSPNPEIGYEGVPDVELEEASDSFRDYVGRSNSLGFRDRDHEVEKPEGVYRIMVLGDSVAVGQGVRRADAVFPARVERRLLDAGLAVELLNFAVTGYNTQQEVWTLHDKGLAYQPDLVLLNYCLNDRGRSDGGILPTLLERQRAAGAVNRTRSHPWLLESALYRFLRYRLGNLGEQPPPIAGDTVPEAMAMLAELRDHHGFEVLVVIFPRFGKLLEEYRFMDEHESIRRLARRHRFQSLDLLPAFQECRRHAKDRLAIDSYHPTPLGHRCAAQEISRYLLRNRAALGIPGADGS